VARDKGPGIEDAPRSFEAAHRLTPQRMAAIGHYAKNVFINCPFAAEYSQIFNALVFAVHDCGYVARSAQELRDTGEVRIDKILRLIEASRFGIHDISRTDLDPRTRLPHFNMPLELGVFLGARAYGDSRQRRKVTLVLERRKYSYMKFCSDISGQDLESHGGRPSKAILVVRDWLRTHSPFGMPSGQLMVERCRRFRRQLPATCAKVGLEPNSLIFVDYAALVTEWLKANPIEGNAKGVARATR
jgi:hypothetical protein